MKVGIRPHPGAAPGAVGARNPGYFKAVWVAGAEMPGAVLSVCKALKGNHPGSMRRRVDQRAKRGEGMSGSIPAKLLLAISAYVSTAAIWAAVAAALPFRLQLSPTDTAWLLSGAWAVWLAVSAGLAFLGAHRWSGLQEAVTWAAGEKNAGAALVPAHRDSLTDLPNRDLLRDRLDQAIAHAGRSGNPSALLFLDLDRFKSVNDTLGHSVGDILLKLVARRIASCVRESDTVARLGGDEFAIVAPNVESIEAIEALAQRLLERIGRPFGIKGNEVRTTVSIGICVFSDTGVDVDRMLHSAEEALYRAKETGRNNHHFFALDMDADASRRAKVEIELRAAVDHGDLTLHFQPKVDLRNGAITGLEALMRWQHPQEGWISPVEFIPIAEECGLILPLGTFALRRACNQAKAWQDAGLPPVRVAVNLSATQFQYRDLAAEVANILNETGLDGRWLEVELTESVVLKDPDRVIEALNHVRKLGVAVALDDFGTGYSSLSYLKRLPLDKLKIDRSFVGSLDVNKNDAAIVTAVIGLGHTLNLGVIAEGVENERIEKLLKTLGCTEAQGFYYSRPLPAESMVPLLAAGHIHPAQAVE